MDPELTPQELDELLAAYALDAVDDDERDAIEAHLASDAHARSEVLAFRHAAALLAYRSAPVPDGVWEGLAQQIEARRHAPVVSLRTRRQQPERKPVSPQPRRPSRARWLVAAAVAAVLVVGGGIALVASGSGDGLSRRQELAAEAAAARRARGATNVVLHASDGTAVGSAVMLRNGKGYLTSELPALPADRAYQLWALTDADHDPVSLGVLGSDPRVVAFSSPSLPRGLAVTEEVAGGVKASVNAPVATAQLPAA